LGIGGLIGGVALIPIGLRRSPLALQSGIERAHLVGHVEERLLGKAEAFLGQADLLLAQRRAVGLFGALLVGAAIADVAVTDDKRGLVPLRLGLGDGGGDGGAVVAVHFGHVPAIGQETLGHILGKGQLGAALDRDLVVVVKIDQLAQGPVARQRGRLRGDALHQIAVADDGIGMVVNDLVAGLVEPGGHEALGQRQAHAVAKALSQRAGGGLDARGQAMLRMAGGLAAPLPEALQLFHGQVVAAKVQQRIEQHGAMPGGEDETVAVEPVGVLGVVLQELGPQHVGDVGHAHGHARVAGIGLLHAIHDQGTDGVDGELLEVRLCHS
jgi:hypothetical protein